MDSVPTAFVDALCAKLKTEDLGKLRKIGRRWTSIVETHCRRRRELTLYLNAPGDKTEVWIKIFKALDVVHHASLSKYDRIQNIWMGYYSSEAMFEKIPMERFRTKLLPVLASLADDYVFHMNALRQYPENLTDGIFSSLRGRARVIKTRYVGGKCVEFIARQITLGRLEHLELLGEEWPDSMKATLKSFLRSPNFVTLDLWETNLKKETNLTVDLDMLIIMVQRFFKGDLCEGTELEGYPSEEMRDLHCRSLRGKTLPLLDGLSTRPETFRTEYRLIQLTQGRIFELKYDVANKTCDQYDKEGLVLHLMAHRLEANNGVRARRLCRCALRLRRRRRRKKEFTVRLQVNPEVPTLINGTILLLAWSRTGVIGVSHIHRALLPVEGDPRAQEQRHQQEAQFEARFLIQRRPGLDVVLALQSVISSHLWVATAPFSVPTPNSLSDDGVRARHVPGRSVRHAEEKGPRDPPADKEQVDVDGGDPLQQKARVHRPSTEDSSSIYRRIASLSSHDRIRCIWMGYAPTWPTLPDQLPLERFRTEALPALNSLADSYRFDIKPSHSYPEHLTDSFFSGLCAPAQSIQTGYLGEKCVESIERQISFGQLEDLKLCGEEVWPDRTKVTIMAFLNSPYFLSLDIYHSNLTVDLDMLLCIVQRFFKGLLRKGTRLQGKPSGEMKNLHRALLYGGALPRSLPQPSATRKYRNSLAKMTWTRPGPGRLRAAFSDTDVDIYLKL
uniref:F-box domain-containing protein n=1 Tax=Steinernema glaseri TaxID=37863 RepID=A0A1I7XVI8_9BILA